MNKARIPSLPRVYNQSHKDAPSSAVYVGRGTPYGNPFILNKHGGRDEVCNQYQEYLVEKMQTELDFAQKLMKDLRGKDLICHCAPKRCHADFLILIANSPEAAK